MAAPRASGARTLGRGLTVLRAVGRRGQGATVAEVCADTGFDRAVVHRLLATLAEEGFVHRDPRSRRFRLGLALIELGGQARAQLEVGRAARVALRQLKDATRESTCLAVCDGEDAVIVDRVETAGGPGRMPLPVGTRVPLRRFVHGRVMLAEAPPGGAAGGSGSGAAGGDEPAAVGQQGFGVGSDEVAAGLVEVAAPVRGPEGEVLASLGLIAPAARVANPARLGPRVRTVAQEVSRRLGWAG